MIITTGIYKNKKILVPDNNIRPTSEKNRIAVLNSIQDILQNSIILELFAGSGAFGLEALSRGALKVIAIENNTKIFDYLKKNFENIIKDKTKYKLIKSNVLSVDYETIEKPDIIFADPFYEDSNKYFEFCYNLALRKLKNSYFIFEHSKKDDYSNYKFFNKLKIFGDTAFSYFYIE